MPLGRISRHRVLLQTAQSRRTIARLVNRLPPRPPMVGFTRPPCDAGIIRATTAAPAALSTPASLAMLGATFDEHERSHAIGIWAGVGALTAAAGPVLGGWLVDQVSWRAIFLLNVPLAVAAAGLAVGFACESRDDNAK